MTSPEWFLNWFNSPYYHLLYNHRNFDEAQKFVENLHRHLALPAHARAWDLACGKGRHSLALHKLGLDVTGTDISENSIQEALRSAEDGLEFYVHDMRLPFRINYFDVVLNLFTSLGYFENPGDNLRVFQNVRDALKPKAVFVLDFFNSKKVLAGFHSNYTEKREGIEFRIRKQVQNKCILKHIEFSCGEKDYFFEENVSLLEKDDFESMAHSAGLKVMNSFGNYQLGPFDPLNSDRLIMLFQK
ncbi:MAG TPA: methyltransferase domain-containing protein [Bacteroidia bacterium]|nr:methyltransferase domain-containing protein [Bacteroidia bacterium]